MKRLNGEKTLPHYSKKLDEKYLIQTYLWFHHIEINICRRESVISANHWGADAHVLLSMGWELMLI